jgi:hypothetical protein
MEGQHVNRLYRRLHEGHDLVYFSVKLKESDLAIGVDNSSYSDSLVSLCRQELIGAYPTTAGSFATGQTNGRCC